VTTKNKRVHISNRVRFGVYWRRIGTTQWFGRSNYATEEAALQHFIEFGKPDSLGFVSIAADDYEVIIERLEIKATQLKHKIIRA